MAIKVDSVEILKTYFSGVVRRANHHAPHVADIIYKLLGIIILLKDSGTDIEVRETGDGETGNILWVYVNNTRFAFRYEHSNQTIEIRKNSNNGPLQLSINNTTPTEEIFSVLT